MQRERGRCVHRAPSSCYAPPPQKVQGSRTLRQTEARVTVCWLSLCSLFLSIPPLSLALMRSANPLPLCLVPPPLLKLSLVRLSPSHYQSTKWVACKLGGLQPPAVDMLWPPPLSHLNTYKWCVHTGTVHKRHCLKRGFWWKRSIWLCFFFFYSLFNFPPKQMHISYMKTLGTRKWKMVGRWCSKKKTALIDLTHFVTSAKTTTPTPSTPDDFLSETCRPLQGCTLVNCSSNSHRTTMLNKLALSSLNLSEEDERERERERKKLYQTPNSVFAQATREANFDSLNWGEARPGPPCVPKKPKHFLFGPELTQNMEWNYWMVEWLLRTIIMSFNEIALLLWLTCGRHPSFRRKILIYEKYTEMTKHEETNQKVSYADIQGRMF